MSEGGDRIQAHLAHTSRAADAPVDPSTDAPADAAMRAKAAVERVAKESWARLVAFLAVRSGDVAGAEDALSDALAAALQRWPVDGVPESPEGWLLASARHRLIDEHRRHRSAQSATRTHGELWRQEMARAHRSFKDAHRLGRTIEDDRLRLMFACGHPAIGEDVRTALMLQLILGVEASRIASAFVMAPSAMAQRLVRAKQKIRDAGISFALPESVNLRARLPFVLDAIYAAFGLGWDALGGEPGVRELSEEGLALGRLVAKHLPDEPEALGLLSLMLFCQSRSRARRADDGAYVPLAEQDMRLWDADMIDEAEVLLRTAAKRGEAGRYQLEAAIQSAHASRRVTGATDWPAIVELYEMLIVVAPSLGADIGHAAASAEALGPARGLELLDAIDADEVSAFQPYWALRGHVLMGLMRSVEAGACFRRAAGLSEDPAVRAYLLERADAAARAR